MAVDLKSINPICEEYIPGWGEENICVKLRRPSLLLMAKGGTIPNSLMATAQKLFNGGKGTTEIPLKEMAELLYIVAEHALVEPSMKELEEAGLELTDLQLSSIFNFTQLGCKALEPFRPVKKNN